MTGPEIAAIGFAAMLGAVFLRVPVAVALGLTGFFGTWAVVGNPNAMLSQMKTLPYDTFSSHTLSIVPLFLLMGQVATRAGLSASLFEAASAILGHRRGGLGMAVIGASAGFGAISGSSLATASTMGQVALPQLRARGYSDQMATGVLAAGGTLGILIPPSVILVIYAVLTQQNIVTMFIAALGPGILATLGYMLTTYLVARLRPDLAGQAPRIPWADRWRILARVWPVVAIFGLVMGGIAADWNWAKDGVQALFTPTEGAAVGLLATLAYGAGIGGLTWAGLRASILETAQATAMIFFILLGAQMFNTFLAFSQTPQALTEWIDGAGVSPWAVLAAMLLAYLVLGCVMESLSMILLTIPVFFPVLMALDFGMSAEATAVWFGILALMVVEIGLITPPVGLNLFIINGLARDVPMVETWKGVLPFLLSDALRVALIVAVPGIALWLAGL